MAGCGARAGKDDFVAVGGVFAVLDAVLHALHAAAGVPDAGSGGTETVVHAVEVQEFLLTLAFGVVAGCDCWELEAEESIFVEFTLGR